MSKNIPLHEKMWAEHKRRAARVVTFSMAVLALAIYNITTAIAWWLVVINAVTVTGMIFVLYRQHEISYLIGKRAGWEEARRLYFPTPPPTIFLEGYWLEDRSDIIDEMLDDLNQ